MSDVSLRRGTKEYLTVTVTASVLLDAQTVEFSFDNKTWTAASWIGTPANTRQAHLLVDTATLPAKASVPVYVRITNLPEIPVLLAGHVSLR